MKQIFNFKDQLVFVKGVLVFTLGAVKPKSPVRSLPEWIPTYYQETVPGSVVLVN